MANQLYLNQKRVKQISVWSRNVKKIFRGNTLIWSGDPLDDTYEFKQGYMRRGTDVWTACTYPYTSLTVYPGKWKVVVVGGGGNSYCGYWDADNRDYAWSTAGGSGACIAGTFSLNASAQATINVGYSTFANLPKDSSPKYGNNSLFRLDKNGTTVVKVEALGGTNILGYIDRGTGYGYFSNQPNVKASISDCTVSGATAVSSECFDGMCASELSVTVNDSKTYPYSLSRDVYKYGLAYSTHVSHGNGNDYAEPFEDATSLALGTVGGYVKIMPL